MGLKPKKDDGIFRYNFRFFGPEAVVLSMASPLFGEVIEPLKLVGMSTLFDDLKGVCSGIKRHELPLIEKHFIRSQTQDGKKQQGFRLIQFLFENPDANSREARTEIAPKASGSTFNKVVERTYDRFVDTFLGDDIVRHPDFGSKLAPAIIRLRKKMEVASTMHARAIGTSKTVRLFEEVYQMAMEFEAYDIARQSAHRLYMLAILYDSDDRRAKEASYNQAVTHLESFERVEQSYASYYSLYVDHVSIEQRSAKIKYLTEVISDIRNSTPPNASKRIRYYLQVLQAELACIRKDYDENIKILLELNTFVQSHKHHFANFLPGQLLSDVADAQMCSHRLDDAASMTYESNKFYAVKGFNYKVNVRIRFMCQFAMGRYAESHRTILPAEKSKDSGQYGAFHHAQISYLVATVCFALGQKKAALNKLADTKALDQNLEGYNIHLRFLQIMALVELGDHDTANSRIESLRKFQSRHSKFFVRERENLLVLLFRRLKTARYDFEKATDKLTPELARLDGWVEGERWEIKSAELIPVHAWFEAKRKGHTQMEAWHPQWIRNYTKQWQALLAAGKV